MGLLVYLATQLWSSDGVWASPGGLLEMQNPRLHPRPIEAESRFKDTGRRFRGPLRGEKHSVRFGSGSLGTSSCMRPGAHRGRLQSSGPRSPAPMQMAHLVLSPEPLFLGVSCCLLLSRCGTAPVIPSQMEPEATPGGGGHPGRLWPETPQDLSLLFLLLLPSLSPFCF